ncbi:acyl-CoA dehydrogenase family protein [Gordonia sp. (in: high G+C Gram-positive bacteria)]|uniref:acyl-CoA dehydrogenase family protein n=1 Tax=Gordonia sp. (in: high G+C Gram-positive bacteria) TaxID=84139 RepID=UPI0016BB25CD|nr:acyl-CoA dehydrogenase family protein [Gordonia sp. (in: high G+C Gram-positive bacteria)]NLG48020.1 acyl-CoA/acyl-ACP dehydrogenase [Gordonia sp. (in: high G+C Gram-positive bacteria)]
MDFALDPTAAAVRDVADEAIRRLQPDWESKFADGFGGFDNAAWDALVASGVTVLALPESLGGDDLPIDALVPLLMRAGQDAVVAPLVGTLTSALLLAKAPNAAAHGRSIADGGWHAVAIGERGSALGDQPTLTLTDTADGARLDGVKTGVLAADGAASIVVVADRGVVIVPAAAAGVSITRTTSSSGQGEYRVVFDGVAVPASDILSDSPQPAIDIYRALLAAYADGLVAGAIKRTAEHVSTRHQFGKPIAAFQAVGQQLADVYVVSRTMNLIATAAAWDIANDADAEEDLATAMYWVAAELPATLRMMTHLHGGVGVDVTYPLHRYFSLVKDAARLAGGAHSTLDVLADETVPAGQEALTCS